MTGPPVIMVDLDGTLSDNSRRYLSFFPPDRPPDWDNNWHDYSMACIDDPPIPYMIEVVVQLQRSYDIAIVTGRHDCAAEVTGEWLDRYGVTGDAGLFMRADGNRQSNASIKLSYLDALREDDRDVELIIDDHPKVIAVFKEIGVATMEVWRPEARGG